MCGIMLLVGPNASTRLPACLHRLRHRGPDDHRAWMSGDLALGFVRLQINGDEAVGRQPLLGEGTVAAFNGEIYNHESLAEAHGLPRSACDVRVVTPLLARKGPRVIDDLDGFYSGVVIRPPDRSVLCFRDHMGKKPLFVGRSGTELFIASEMKALDQADWFELLPRGVSAVDLDTGAVRVVAAHRRVSGSLGLEAAFAEAVRKRLPARNQPVALFLSGGLDSSLVASFASRLRSDITYFTLGDDEHPDHRAARVVADALGLRDVRAVPLPDRAALPGLIRDVVHATESFNPSIVSNGLATFLLAKSAREAGIKVVLTGEGADELFGGYHSFEEGDPWRETRERLIDDMQYTELRRLDLCCMAHSVEPRCPFLDRAVRRISDECGFRDFFDAGRNKAVLRRTFADALPAEILDRRKTSFDVGSGIRGEVVRYLRRNGRTEREELHGIWRTLFDHGDSSPYFNAYPVFDEAIDSRAETHR